MTRWLSTSRRQLRIGLQLAMLGGVLLVGRSAAAQEREAVQRLDPETWSLVEVPPDELKPGHVYNHFDPRLDRRVWSVYLPGGGFWYAFGEGTTQPLVQFDVRIPLEELEQALPETAPQLRGQIQSLGPRVSLRLNRNNQWNLVSGRPVTSIYNAETGERWEQHFLSYLPVRHSGGYRWTPYGYRYAPVCW